ncbi:MAG: ATP-binding protein [Egibacteraceae bacterium]
MTSPGPFVSGVTVNNVLTTSSRSRNATPARAVRTLGLAETAGTGVDRMYVEMARSAASLPRSPQTPIMYRPCSSAAHRTPPWLALPPPSQRANPMTLTRCSSCSPCSPAGR